LTVDDAADGAASSRRIPSAWRGDLAPTRGPREDQSQKRKMVETVRVSRRASRSARASRRNRRERRDDATRVSVTLTPIATTLRRIFSPDGDAEEAGEDADQRQDRHDEREHSAEHRARGRW